MKTTTAALLCILFLFAPAASWGAQIDASDAGTEVLSPNTVKFHNLYHPGSSTHLYGVFRWSPWLNIWYPTEFGQEEPIFRASEFWPVAEGNSWTYANSYGGTFTLTVSGTEDICGQPSLRLLDSGGTTTYWISDDTGFWMTRYVNADGTYTDYCPAMKIAPATAYLGSQSLHPFFDAPSRLPTGEVYGISDGWSQFVVKGLETVTVPAGTYENCVRATFNYSYTNTADNSFGVRTEETWHAPGIGFVKRVKMEAYGWDGMIFYSSSDVHSLVSYTVSP